eukprot:1155033-Pelagomonas_calceolata.AAC.7
MATMGERLLYKPIPSQHHGFSASQQKPANTSVVHKDTGTDVTSSRSPEGPRVFHNRSTIDHGQSSMTDQITDMDGNLSLKHPKNPDFISEDMIYCKEGGTGSYP